MRAQILLIVPLSLVLPCSARAQVAAKRIPAGAKLFIAPMPDGFNDTSRPR